MFCHKHVLLCFGPYYFIILWLWWFHDFSAKSGHCWHKLFKLFSWFLLYSTLFFVCIISSGTYIARYNHVLHCWILFLPFENDSACHVHIIYNATTFRFVYLCLMFLNFKLKESGNIRDFFWWKTELWTSPCLCLELSNFECFGCIRCAL
jgi:hypothetical protein